MVVLSVNELIVNVDTEIVYRILWINKSYKVIYVIDVNERLALPFQMLIKDVEEKIESAEYSIQVDSGVFLKRKPTEKDIEFRDKAWITIKDLVNLEPEIYHFDKRKKVIDEAMNQYGIKSHKTFYKNLRKYWQRGKVKDSVFPDYALNKVEISYKKKTGRPKVNGKKGIVITPEIKNQFEKSIKKYYLSTKKPSLSFTYKMMIRDYFIKFKYFDESNDEKLVLKPEEERPTKRQFYYWFNNEYKNDKVTIAREGPKKFEQNYRAVLGSSTAETEGPGDTYQIDATPGNVYLVNRLNPNWIVGRPTTYFIVDVYTHLITGLYVGLENASWKAMMSAIANACMDKTEYCKRYGINISMDEWPSMHLPNNFIGDRGELASQGVNHLIEGLGTNISNTPPYRPDWKGIVEKLFDTSQEKIKPFLPGYVHEDHGERGAKDYRLEASLNIEEYTRILIKFILFYNNNFYMGDYVRSEQQIKDNVQPIPIKLWEWGVKNAAGKLKKPNIKDIKFYLLPRDKATITENGIRYKKMFYTTARAINEQWFSKARKDGSWKVDFSYDPRNMDVIYLHTNDEERYIPCTLLNHQDRYKDKTIEEIEQLLENEKEDFKGFEHTQLEKEVNLFKDIENIVKVANKNKEEKLDKTISKSKRTKNIKEHKREERIQRREEEAFNLEIDNQEKLSSISQQNEDIEEINPLRISIKQLFANEGRNKK
ncbi:Mu transposase C-terminal domain-containing protein [Psychrobacillus sp. NEAU-3TGS]|uniref:Mu transposase C-terminal domain-containing protein n=1 Tax=Psychrobacillus sp. NEAU-3TGS TaxID=2995412 RepID=UPI00249C277A|nr:Mu transposase C-terminal domain-containing protein [Psychrobacillus sp. NEAU-3TGS]